MTDELLRRNWVPYEFLRATKLKSCTGPDAAYTLRGGANFSGLICVHFCCIENFLACMSAFCLLNSEKVKKSTV